MTFKCDYCGVKVEQDRAESGAEDHQEVEEVMLCLENFMRVHPTILHQPGNLLILLCNIFLCYLLRGGMSTPFGKRSTRRLI